MLDIKTVLHGLPLGLPVAMTPVHPWFPWLSLVLGLFHSGELTLALSSVPRIETLSWK